jgi:hypothetical protein
LHLIDPWVYQSTNFYPGDQANRPDNENLAAHQNIIRSFAHLPGVIIRQDYSFDAAPKYPDGFFDFAFIDAIHTMPMCLADCVAWWPKIRKGGWLTGHDLNLGEMPGCPALSVYAALQQFLFLIHRQILDLVTYEQDSWGIQK